MDDEVDSGVGEQIDPMQSVSEHVALASQVGSILSIIASGLVLITYGFIRRYQPQLTNRVSLRLAIAGTACDMLYAIGLLISAKVTGPGPMCNGSMFFQMIFLMMSLFVTAAIGLNLLLIFVIKMRATKYFERAYYAVSAVLALAIPLVALCLGKFGWDGTECWYTYDEEDDASYKDAFTWQWITYYGWIIAVVLFCLACTVLFYWAVRRQQPLLQGANESSSGRPSTAPGTGANSAFARTDVLVRQAVDRIKWYCLVPLVANFFSLWTDIQFFIHESSTEWIWIVANFLAGAQGALNACVFFFFDPSVRHARNRLRVAIVYRYYLRYHSLDPMTTSMSTVSSSAHILPKPVPPHDGSDLRVKPTLKLRKQPHSQLAFNLARLLVRQGDIDKYIMNKQNKSRTAIKRPVTVSKPSESQTSGKDLSSMGTHEAVEQLDSLGGTLGRDAAEAIELL